MTSDEMIETFKKVRQEFGNSVNVSIAPLLKSHPEQLDDFINKYAVMMAEEIALETGESQSELGELIASEYRNFFQDYLPALLN